ncbi:MULTISPECIES: LLM class flavin-dependent oxidoreductase [unclassified Streptomyces]|uniref:LLM class flavin-dependent oxidoreductase n=1 Tax=unclassified Streptomyces TaxID=2593676 RepID=UPI000F4E45CE|nr:MULTISPECIES: LLM class flavin-dependent oxidoreductase [unclassified Streptomyces]MDH6454523.1 limonene 1,2-monooxygenase [Streptomyces sp. SAI-119]MDH6494919.1 limonene 1,2-monooxygenase [Streptomyces sp. SAI-149]QUC57951.1 LLM class flavin-dependent oxidoreductase [Streptomyces sp. A2-16]
MDRIGFGAFLSPLHPLGEDPTLSMWRDMELVEWLDQLGYDEFWVGEHHSAGWGTIASPELFIAAAAERTRHIRLGTGVTSLPYHHPFMVASRAVQLDHMTRGRFQLGVGAGSLPSDMHILGIDPAQTRPRTAEALEVILHLLRSEEPLTRSTDWFELRDARLQLRPYSAGGIPLAVSSASSPSGMRLAGRHGLGALSLGTPRPGTSPSDLRAQWEHAEEAAAEHGRTADRADWRVTLPVHIAETREDAYRDVVEGWLRYRNEYWAQTLGLPIALSRADARKALETAVDNHGAIIGSVDDAIEAVARVQEATGGFGRLLVTVQDWAPRDRMKHSFELLARFVAPRFNGSLRGLEASQEWTSRQTRAWAERHGATLLGRPAPATK